MSKFKVFQDSLGDDSYKEFLLMFVLVRCGFFSFNLFLKDYIWNISFSRSILAIYNKNYSTNV